MSLMLCFRDKLIFSRGNTTLFLAQDPEKSELIDYLIGPAWWWTSGGPGSLNA